MAQSPVSNEVTVTNPGTQSSVAGTVVSLQIEASYSFIEQGRVQALTYAAAGLPGGLSVDSSTGLISGTIPDDVAGAFPVTVTAHDTTGASGSAAFTWTVHSKVTVANPAFVVSTLDTPASLQIEAASPGFRLTLTYTAAGLPPGLSINRSTGLISGTPSGDPGVFTVTVTAQDSTGGSGSAVFEWKILPKVTVTSPGSQASATGTAVSLQIKASSSPGGQTLGYEADGLPSGLSIGSSTGLISGTTPGKAGTFTVKVLAIISFYRGMEVGALGSAVFTWTVGNLVTVTHPGTMVTAVDTAASLQIAAVSERPLTYTAAGLPPGLSIGSSTGLISGTIPGTEGTGAYTVTVTAQDTTGSTGSAVFDWIIVDAVTVTNPGTQTSVAGTAVGLQIQASDTNSLARLTYTAAGLPPGLSINRSTGLISGTTPGAPGPFPVTVTVTDTILVSGSAMFLWTVTELGE